jgi:hypothetical protein
MATSSSVQGFVKSANLKENELDRNAINNLGEAPIADDISLFINNTKNESVLNVFESEYDRITGRITIINSTIELSASRASVYTNGDKVRLEKLDGTVVRDNLYIRNSDGETSFEFATDDTLNNQFTLSLREDFNVFRYDTVSLENMNFLGVAESTASFSSGLATGDSDINSGDGSATAVEEENTYNSRFGGIYEYLDVAKYLAKKKFVEDEDVATDDKFDTEGTFTIEDPSDTILDVGITNDTPGIFITDPNSSVLNIQRIRAFSDTSNPWEETGSATNSLGTSTGFLQTGAISAQAGVLKLNTGIKVDGITPQASSGNISATYFSHKIKVNLNGVDYFLCINQV